MSVVAAAVQSSAPIEPWSGETFRQFAVDQILTAYRRAAELGLPNPERELTQPSEAHPRCFTRLQVLRGMFNRECDTDLSLLQLYHLAVSQPLRSLEPPYGPASEIEIVNRCVQALLHDFKLEPEGRARDMIRMKLNGQLGEAQGSYARDINAVRVVVQLDLTRCSTPERRALAAQLKRHDGKLTLNLVQARRAVDFAYAGPAGDEEAIVCLNLGQPWSVSKDGLQFLYLSELQSVEVLWAPLEAFSPLLVSGVVQPCPHFVAVYAAKAGFAPGAGNSSSGQLAVRADLLTLRRGLRGHHLDGIALRLDGEEPALVTFRHAPVPASIARSPNPLRAAAAYAVEERRSKRLREQVFVEKRPERIVEVLVRTANTVVHHPWPMTASG